MHASTMWVLISGLLIGCTAFEDQPPSLRIEGGKLEATCIDQNMCGGRVFSYTDAQTLEQVSLSFSLEAVTATTLDQLREEFSGGAILLADERFQLEAPLTICGDDNWRFSLTRFEDGILTGVGSSNLQICEVQGDILEGVSVEPVRVEFELVFDPADEL